MTDEAIAQLMASFYGAFDNRAGRAVDLASLRGGAAYSGEGRKFILLCQSEGRWRIVSVLWEDLPNNISVRRTSAQG